MKDSLARTWGQVGPDGRRQRRRATGATALWLAATTLALAGAGALCAATDIGGAAGPALTAGPADLLVRLAYRASEPSRLRFYRGTSLDELVSVGEYAIPAGFGQTRFVDSGRRAEAWIYQVRLVDAGGAESVLGTIVWHPQRLTPQSESAVQSLNPLPAILPVADAVEPPRFGAVALQTEIPAGTKHRKPLSPPPKPGAG